ncbi:MAG: hypothetical protein QOF48_2575 [Verrucomicrobiota bacterium]|jgi:hypothetical protein
MPATPFPPAQAASPSPDEIASLAYQLYLDGGQQCGTNLEDWLCAEYFLIQSNPCEWRAAAETEKKPRVTTPMVPVIDAVKKPAPNPESPRGGRAVRLDKEAMAVSAAAEREGQETDEWIFQPGHQQEAVSEADSVLAGPQYAILEESLPFERWKGINE